VGDAIPCSRGTIYPRGGDLPALETANWVSAARKLKLSPEPSFKRKETILFPVAARGG
jgi:hypothetical protein